MQKKFANDIIKVLLNNFLTGILILVSGVILARILGPAYSGRIISIYIIPGLLIQLTILGSRQSAIFHLGKKHYSDEQIVSSLLFIWIFFSFLAVIISIINFAIIKHADLTILTYVIILSAIPLRLFIVFAVSIFLGKAKFNFFNLFTLLPELMNFIIIVAFALLKILSIQGFVFSYFCSSLFVALLCFLKLKQIVKIKFNYNKKIIRSVTLLGLVNAIALFIMQLNYRIDIVFMYKYTTPFAVGIYALGASFAGIIWQIPDAMGLVVKSRVASALNPVNLRYELSSLLRISIILGIISTVTMYFLAPYVIPLFYGEAFKSSVTIFQTILPGIFTFVIFRTISGVITGMGKPGIIIKIFVPALIVNIVLNLFWIPVYGGVGAAWASNVSYSLGALATLIVFSRKMKISLAKIFKFNLADFSFIINYVRFRTKKY